MSAVCLLDVNVLIALAWPNHEFHVKVQHWFSAREREKWASCPITQSAFVRILSNPAFSPHALTAVDAIALLVSSLQHPGHQFWPDDIGLQEAVAPFRVMGHQQVTDAYLLGLAIHNKGRLATLDRRLAGLLPEKTAVNDLLNVI